MGKRSGVPDTDEALDALPIAQVEAELKRTEDRARIPALNRDPWQRKAAERRIIWLRKYLEGRKAKGG
jgi:hypothetical protein